MILTALKYTRYVDQPRAWQMKGNGDDYAYFDNINLLVGKNASGKSRTLSIIKEIASLLAGTKSVAESSFQSQRFDLIYQEKGINNSEAQASRYNYLLELKDGKVVSEKLIGDDKVIFDRVGGEVKQEELVWLDESTRKSLHEIKDTDLLIASKINETPFFSTFVLWGNSLRNYLFADQTKKRQMITDLNMMQNPEQNKEITGALLFTFHLASQEFGSQFEEEVRECMHELGYTNITNIGIHKTEQGYCIGIEEDKAFVVCQREMSQGLFRALSMFIFVVYSRLKGISACILIDDIGEGIDFDRSKRLVRVMTNKIAGSSIQCFMSTNDRMVMNDVPLRYWSVIDRVDAGLSILYDYSNSQTVFEDFQYTSLNNFEFLTTDFYKEGFGESDDEEDDE